jgi:acyl carrier protein
MQAALDEVTLESSNLSLEKWDSLRHLKLIAALGEAFEIEIDDEEMEGCLEVRGIVRLLDGKLAAA